MKVSTIDKVRAIGRQFNAVSNVASEGEVFAVSLATDKGAVMVSRAKDDSAFRVTMRPMDTGNMDGLKGRTGCAKGTKEIIHGYEVHEGDMLSCVTHALNWMHKQDEFA